MGQNKGKYENLDFSYLIDLSTIDMHLRFLIIKMCLDIEHDLKRCLLNDIYDDPDEDGYTIVNEFLEENEYLQNDICTKINSAYVGDLINKYFEFEQFVDENKNQKYRLLKIECPIWAYLEIISFGPFIKLYEYYYQDEIPVSASLLHSIKSLRNAAAHNNCLINNLKKGYTKPCREISDFVSSISEITKDVRKRHLSVRPIFEFVCLLKVYNDIVSCEIKRHRYTELEDLFNDRIIRHADYYENQQTLIATYKFIKKIIDFLI